MEMGTRFLGIDRGLGQLTGRAVFPYLSRLRMREFFDAYITAAKALRNQAA